MHFGSVLAAACSSFAVTNIDDIFVLVTFYAEASQRQALTPTKIVIGQYIGFTFIVVISLIEYGASLLIRPEPIGFLGLLPILLGVWHMLDFIPRLRVPEDKQEGARVKSVFKVALVTIMNGGDNVGTYIPLFSQAKGAEIAVYVVVFYILLGVWCFAAYLAMSQKHLLMVAQKYAQLIVPFLYVGLGIFIIIKSNCFPWSIEHIDRSTSTNLGRTIMAVVTTFTLLTSTSAMLWARLQRGKLDQMTEGVPEHANSSEMDLEPGTQSTHSAQPATERLEIPPLSPGHKVAPTSDHGHLDQSFTDAATAKDNKVAVAEVENPS